MGPSGATVGDGMGSPAATGQLAGQGGGGGVRTRRPRSQATLAQPDQQVARAGASGRRPGPRDGRRRRIASACSAAMVVGGTPGVTVQSGVHPAAWCGGNGLRASGGGGGGRTRSSTSAGEHLGQEPTMGGGVGGRQLSAIREGLGGDGGQVQLGAGNPGWQPQRPAWVIGLHTPTSADAATWPTGSWSRCRGERVWLLASRTPCCPVPVPVVAGQGL